MEPPKNTHSKLYAYGKQTKDIYLLQWGSLKTPTPCPKNLVSQPDTPYLRV